MFQMMTVLWNAWTAISLQDVKTEDGLYQRGLLIIHTLQWMWLGCVFQTWGVKLFAKCDKKILIQVLCLRMRNRMSLFFWRQHQISDVWVWWQNSFGMKFNSLLIQLCRFQLSSKESWSLVLSSSPTRAFIALYQNNRTALNWQYAQINFIFFRNNKQFYLLYLKYPLPFFEEW